MEEYYKLERYGVDYYVCPVCGTTEFYYELFYEHHKDHLCGFETKTKKDIFLKRHSTATVDTDGKRQKFDPESVSVHVVESDLPDIVSEHHVDATAADVAFDDFIVVDTWDATQIGSGVIDEPEVEYDLFRSHQILRLNIARFNQKDITLSPRMLEKLNTTITEMGQCKIQFGIHAEFINKYGDIRTAHISNAAEPMSDTFLEDGAKRLNEKIEKITESGSDWILNRILEVNFKVTKVSKISRLAGKSYIATPSKIVNAKMGLINVRNEDNLCFIYSILAVLKADIVKINRCRPSSYQRFLSELKYDKGDMPMKLDGISKFESQNKGLAINVLSYNDNPVVTYVADDDVVMKHPHIDIVRRSNVADAKQIYLLLLEQKDNYHYVAVRNIQRLMNIQTNISCRIQCKWCEYCLNGFRKREAYDKHLLLCKKNSIGTTLYSMPTDQWLKFSDWSKMVTPPFVIYADFESVLPRDDIHYQKHLPVSAGLLLVNNFTGARNYYDFIGDECVLDFLKKVEDIAINVVKEYYDKESHKPMRTLSVAEEAEFQNSKKCYLCKQNIKNKVRDHDHFTGEYLGPSCNQCNLARKINLELPVVFHNLRGYDLHHILKYGVSKFPKWELSCIPISSEKFLSLIVHLKKMTIRFIDSYQFLNESLAEVVKTLNNNLPITRAEFNNNGLVMSSKGIFPYNFATSLQVLQTTTQLPPIWSDVSESDYNEAQNIWTQMGCRTLLDYMMIYLKLDVTLLADVFQQFRLKSIEHNRLEPLRFFGVPGMAWASALMTLEKPIELLQDNEMYNFFEGGIRGGLTFVNKHFACASDDTELLYIDINNLYGWALSQKLPYQKFQWVLRDDILQDILTECQNSDLESLNYGYVMEVDIVVPDEVQDYLDQFPVAAEAKCPPGSKVKKLLLTHEPKCNYVVHWRLLQMYLTLGAKVVKIHRAIRFQQAAIFKNYVDENTALRAQSTSDFDKNYYKLKNNSLYGKTVENLKKRINLRLCNTKKRLMTYASKPGFKRSIKVADDLIAVLLNKDIVCLDRPSYIGQTVLDLSKLRMYTLQYVELEKYRKQFNCEINIMAGDTDSFFLECKGVKLNQLLPAMIKDQLLDTSNYDKNDPLCSDKLASVVGKFKDESKGQLSYKEWIFLRPKCYSLLSEQKTTMKAKGIRLKGTDINHETYKSVYSENSYVSVPQTRIGTRNHQLFTFQTNKVALTNADDKRVWIGTNESLAYGHYFIRDDLTEDLSDLPNL